MEDQTDSNYNDYEDYSEVDFEKIYKNNSEELQNKKILVVGAGGIGCELLKSLVMSGFKNITTVDMDKIEKSNLNRQFLFNKECIGKYKSEMAMESIKKTRGPDSQLNLVGLVGNIKDKSTFDLDFFKSFDVILNALDNIDARTYMNQICIRNHIPLVNSGTEGFLGNVATYVRDLTPCYNCVPKKKQKAIPVCSIRSKPEKMEHCVAWAKSLFELLYCENTNGNSLEGYKIIEDDKINFQNYFFNDILSYKKMTPKADVSPVDVSCIICYEFDNDMHSCINNSFYFDYTKNVHKFDGNSYISNDKAKMILIIIFSAENLKATGKFDKFDKENKDIVNFVFAASNLRAMNFKIKTETRFKIKEIAGNIIPAIASTNAIIASIQTMETIKVLLKKYDLLKNVNFTKDKKIASVSSKSDYKSTQCPVCSQKALMKNSNSISIKVNVSEFTMQQFITLLAEKFNVQDPTISSNSVLLFESGQDLDQEDMEQYESLLSRTFASIKIVNNAVVKVSDMTGKANFNVTVLNENSFVADQFEFSGDVDFANVQAEVEVEEEENNEKLNNKEDEDIIMQDVDSGVINLDENEDHNEGVLIISDNASQRLISNKRKHSDETIIVNGIKKRRTETSQ